MIKEVDEDGDGAISFRYTVAQAYLGIKTMIKVVDEEGEYTF